MAKYLSKSVFRVINEALKLYFKHAEKHCELLAENEKTNLIFHVHSEKALERNCSSAFLQFLIHPNFA
jgi:hypothetical protein